MARRSEEQEFEVQLALAGFLTGYSGTTRLAYQQDLRQFVSWCTSQDLDLLAVRRTHIELFARWLEHSGAARAAIGRRLSTVTGFYRCCVEAELLTHNPAANPRPPVHRSKAYAVGACRSDPLEGKRLALA